MCGIAGIISFVKEVTVPRLQQMTDAIQHRGPEGDGFWIDENAVIGLGHRRLSIIDLSNAGDQPMYYRNRYTITYNGELYNYVELKVALEKKGHSFKSHCDTEVILAAYAEYGQECLQYFDGMFAFAIWDEQQQLLFCARDRFGEKPFYYFNNGLEFLFASEMKGLWAAGVSKEMDHPLLLQYLALGLTSFPDKPECTFFNKIQKLPASNYIALKVLKREQKLEIKVEKYWDLDKESIVEIGETAAKNRLKELLEVSIKRRLRSDVAIGTSLSGGLDSSTIVAIIKQQQAPVQKTFSAVFPGFNKDESHHINQVASYINLESKTIAPTERGLINDFEKLIYHQEEPFQSSSIYAQYKVYELAKQHGVTVLLDGQGADEILAGYHKYFHWYWQELLATGEWTKAHKEISSAKSIGVTSKWGLKNYLSAYLPSITAKQLEKRSQQEILLHTGLNKDFVASNIRSVYKPVVGRLNDILYFNTMQSGLEELLRYADRNSMAHSREVRLPFLNHELVQFIFSLPSNYKIRNGYTKWILREIMDKALPPDILWRKDKVGFEPPQKTWMQHKQMQEYIHEAKRKLTDLQILHPSILNKPIVQQGAHEKGNYEWRYLCAALCM